MSDRHAPSDPIPLDSGELESELLETAYPNQPYVAPRKGDFQAAADVLKVPKAAATHGRHKGATKKSRRGRHSSHKKKAPSTHHRLRSTGHKTVHHTAKSSGKSHSKKHPSTHHKPHKAHVITVAKPHSHHHV